MVDSINDAIRSLPQRDGPRPETGPGMPHQQLTQNAPPVMQEAVLERASGLPGVRVDRSGVSVPDARALILDPTLAKGPPEAFLVGTEFAHLHPPHDGSLHLALPEESVAEVEGTGWGEMHPMARAGPGPRTAVMVFGPRDDLELEVVWGIVRASYAFAVGSHTSAEGEQ
jgi:hypothetical protein